MKILFFFNKRCDESHNRNTNEMVVQNDEEQKTKVEYK